MDFVEFEGVGLMYIAELVEKYNKYGIDRRTIDYYSTLPKDEDESSEKPLIPCEWNAEKTRRIYNEKSEEVIKKMIILRDLGLSSKKIKENITNPSYFTTKQWNDHIKDLEKKRQLIEETIIFAKAMRDANSLPLKMNNLMDPNAVKALTHLYAKIARYINSPDSLMELSEDLPVDLSAFASFCMTFLNAMLTKREQGLTFDSESVQKSVDVLFNQLESYFGTAVYIIYALAKGLDSSFFELTADEEEQFPLIMKVYGVYADWFRKAKTREEILKRERFENECKEGIQMISALVEGANIEEMMDGMREICDAYDELTGDSLEDFRPAVYEGIEASAKGEDISTDRVEEVKKYMDYVIDAIKYHLDKRKSIIEK